MSSEDVKAIPIGKETRICIRRTIQTAPYEGVTVELEETFNFSSRQQRSETYKAMSKTVEAMVNHEAQKYLKAKK